MSNYLDETASQTAGPYVHIGLIPAQAGFDIFQNNFHNQLAGADSQGERIRIEGYVIDGTGAPIRDALLEIWQANAAGRYNHPEDKASPDAPLDPNFRGWGRTGTDFRTALYHFDTIKPGPVPMRDGRIMAPHVNVWIAARGINIGLQTRMYFADESAANAADPLLRLIEQDSRRQTLIAPREGRDGTIVYRFDIRLQGDRETVFLDV